MEYVLTTTYAVSGLVAQAVRATLTDALNGVMNHLGRFGLDARVFADWISGVPIGAWIGLLVLLVGILLIRR